MGFEKAAYRGGCLMRKPPPRIVDAFAAGRIMNTRIARSHLMGGMIWGHALHVID